MTTLATGQGHYLFSQGHIERVEMAQRAEQRRLFCFLTEITEITEIIRPD